MVYLLLADVVVAAHVAYVACVVVGLVLVLAGGALGWGWVHNRWVRGIHLAMIVLVVARTAVWNECPLSTWEGELRRLGGQVDADGDVAFDGWSAGYVMHAAIHPVGVATWVFPVVYVLFGGLVVAALWWVPVAWHAERLRDKKLRALT